MFSLLVCLVSLSLILTIGECYLRPSETASRQTKLLDGIWSFKLAPEQGLNETRNEHSPAKDDNGKDWIMMPVPSSFNDITQDPAIRDYVGWYYYKRDFMLHDGFFNPETSDLFVHFGSVHYHCEVFVNDVYLGSHSSGHLPFEFQINDNPNLKLNLNGKNTIKLFANNILTLHTTIPQAYTFSPANSTNTIYPAGYKQTDNWFDFFNYAGIHRSVTLYTKPKVSIEKVDFNFITDNGSVYLNYSVNTKPLAKEFIQLSLLDQSGKTVLKSKGSTGKEQVENPELWWPYTMNNNRPPHLYTLNVRLLFKSNGSLVDEVNVRTGIRFIEIKDNQLYINSRRLYLTGFGKHEDADIRGKGLDLPLLIRDFNLIKWIQANSFRTSHYPYSEELMDLADEYGVLIIDECPAVSLISFNRSTLDVHKQQLKTLISRDKHHPSVIFWSIANEAESQKPEAEEYFKEVAQLARSLDNRPITAAINKPFDGCYLSQYLDMIMLNRYVAWYSSSGSVELIKQQLLHEFELFHSKYNRPMMISEYGADTVAGFHQGPSRPFSEDYQVDYLRYHFEAFDDLINRGYFIGEHYWNFADFMTKSQYTRAMGNKKGLFTRDRQPKAAAKVMRCRYSKLAAMLDLRTFKPDYQMFC